MELEYEFSRDNVKQTINQNQVLQGNKYKWNFKFTERQDRSYHYHYELLLGIDPFPEVSIIRAGIECFWMESVSIFHKVKKEIYVLSNSTNSCTIDFDTKHRSSHLMTCIRIKLIEEPDVKIPLPSPTNFIKDFCQLRAEEASKDVTIRVGAKEIKAHRFMLTTRSPVFKRMFESNMTERETGVITITDYSYECVAALVEFIYTNECQEMASLADDLLRIADKYELIDLKTKAAIELANTVNVENAAEMFAMFQFMHVDPAPLKHVLNFMAANKEQVMNAIINKSIATAPTEESSVV